jgi:hypothetical protein
MNGFGGSSICLATGILMLAVPTALTLATLPSTLAGSGTGLLIAVVLAVGALAVGLAAARPRGAIMPALAVLCTLLALSLAPPEPVGSGLAGLACLAFLLAVRLHRQAVSGPVRLGQWLAAHRPMAVGAAVTTPPAIVAASVPAAWSLLVAALVGVATAVLCVVLLAGR